MSGTRPRIGLAPCYFHADPQRPVFKGKTLLYLEQSLAHWLMRAGALPLLLPSATEPVTPRELVAVVDGLVLQGGSDVCPASYGEAPLCEEWTGDRVRDEFEIELIQAALELGRPVLGVCRGMQILNVALGGSLYQDIATQHPGCRVHRDWEVYDRLCHDVRFEAGSLLERLYPGTETARVNSVHHQAIRELGNGLVVEARALDDGIVEAVRLDGEPFVYGVQWHPEFQRPGDPALLEPDPLLHAFVQAVAAARPHTVPG